MSTAGAASRAAIVKQPDELDDRHANERFGLSSYQLDKLPARRLSMRESRLYGSYWRVKFYKISDLQALSEQVEQRRAGKQKEAAALPDEAEEEEWIDELKVAEHYKLSAARLQHLPCRKLSRQDSVALGVHCRLKVYKLADVFQLVTDLRAQADEKHETAADRREERQEANQAKAFEAASQAKALVKAWKKPRLSGGQLCLPAELWGLVLQQLLTEDSLWDLPSTAQQLCHVSLTCKGLYSAVQQQGWPQLCRLLAPLRPQPPSTQGRQLTRWDPVQKRQLPANPDLLVTDPASLRVPELKAACTYYGLSSSGTKAELMVKILARFGLSHPCAAPLLVVAHSKIHAVLELTSIVRTGNGYMSTYATPAQESLCQQLRLQYIDTAPEELKEAISCSLYARLPASMQSIAEARAQSAAPHLLAAFPSLENFHHVAKYSCM